MEYVTERLAKLRWPSTRFSLRALLILTMFLACVLGAYRLGRQTAFRQSASSWHYYVVRENANKGDTVSRLRLTGNETVLDAIARVGGLQNGVGHRVSIRRPVTLDIDWRSITQRGDSTTNYQLFPGDRVIIRTNTKTSDTKKESAN